MHHTSGHDERKGEKMQHGAIMPHAESIRVIGDQPRLLEDRPRLRGPVHQRAGKRRQETSTQRLHTPQHPAIEEVERRVGQDPAQHELPVRWERSERLDRTADGAPYDYATGKRDPPGFLNHS